MKQLSQERLKQTAVIKEKRKIYQLEVLQVPSGIIVISVITVGNAVQIKRSCLRSVYFNYLSRITGHAASWCQNNPKHCAIFLCKVLCEILLSRESQV
jgi:hypothetical protein